MRLLIVTQVLNMNHPILGFFHRWVEEFAKHCDSVCVICLEKGVYDLPDNVSVYSLGKEIGVVDRLVYLKRYITLLWKLRKQYDSVFAHMNPEYVIAGYPVWLMTRKKIGMWYAHGAVSIRLRIATVMSRLVLTSTTQGFRIDTPKRKIVGQGIGTSLFTAAPTKENIDELRLITVGRMSPVKHIETLLRCCVLLKKNEILFTFTIVGAAVTDEEKKYEREIHDLVDELDLNQQVVFAGSVAQNKLPAVLQQADLFIHDGQTGSLDKVLLEAMAVGLFVISSNESYKAVVFDTGHDTVYNAGDFNVLAELVNKFKRLSSKEKEDIAVENQTFVKDNHSLVTFISKIMSQYTR